MTPSLKRMGATGSLSRLHASSLLAVVLAGSWPAGAADWYVATNGMARDAGTRAAPWDFTSALTGEHGVTPGDTVWLLAGTYRLPDRRREAPGYAIRLAGTEAAPIQVRAEPGRRVTIDGGLILQSPAAHVWVRDLEILVSENLTRSRRFEEPGSSPASYDRPWGGLNVHGGEGLRFINLVIHDNAQGVSWWRGATNSELYGCLIYDNGWSAPDRGHGHAIYTQNDQGLKAIRDCVMTGGYGYTVHAYGSSRADVNNYLVEGNLCYDGGTFLIGGGRPSHGIRVLTNYLHGVSMQIGYNAPHNEDCEIRGNLIVNGILTVNRYRQAQQADNRILAKSDVRPADPLVILRPNRYDPARAHLALFNWKRQPNIAVSLGGFLQPGDRFRLMNPRDFFGQPVRTGIWNGQPVQVPAPEEFACFVVLKTAAP